MIIILSFSDTVSLSFVMICYTTVVIFNVSLLDELGACTDRPILNFLLWQMLLHEEAQTFPMCLRCLWLLGLCVLMQCNCIGLLW
jgi:hypothetical protein